MSRSSTPNPPKVVISNEQKNFQGGMVKKIQFTVAKGQQILLVCAICQQLNIGNYLKIPQWAFLNFEDLFKQQIQVVYYMRQVDHIWKKMEKVLKDNDIRWKETESNPVEQGTKTYSDLAEIIKRQLSSQSGLLILKIDSINDQALIKKWLQKQFNVCQLKKRHYLIKGGIQNKQSLNPCKKIVKINKTVWINLHTTIKIILQQLYKEHQTSNLQELIFLRSEHLFGLIFKSTSIYKSFKTIGKKQGIYLEGRVKSTEILRQLILQAYRMNVQQCLLLDFSTENLLQLKREYPYTVLVQIFTYFYSKVQQRQLKLNKNCKNSEPENNQISQEEKIKQMQRRRFFYEEEQKMKGIKQLIFDIMFLRNKQSNSQRYQKIRRIIECIHYDISPQNNNIQKDDLHDSYWICLTQNFGKLLSQEFTDKTTKDRKISANTILEDIFKSFKNLQNNQCLDSLLIKLNHGFAHPLKSEQQRTKINNNIYRKIIESQRQQIEYIDQSTLFNIVTKDFCFQPKEHNLDCPIENSSFVFTKIADQNIQYIENFIESLWKKRENGYIFLQTIKDLDLMNKEEQACILQRFQQYYYDLLQIAQSYKQIYDQYWEIMSNYQLFQIQNQITIGPQINKIRFQSYPKCYWIIAIAPD